MGDRWHVDVDRSVCIGSGLCAGSAPGSFRLDSARQSHPAASEVDAGEAVSDGGRSELPSLMSPRLEATGGRGLLPVDALSSTWGVVPRRFCGKSVVAGIRLDGA
jgi:ferredoxin